MWAIGLILPFSVADKWDAFTFRLLAPKRLRKDTESLSPE
jgi:hypothetical protein